MNNIWEIETLHMNEATVLVLSTGVLIFLIAFNRLTKKVPFYKTATLSFLCFFLASFATLVEHYIFPTFLNFFEHLCYTLNSVLLAIWCWQLFSSHTSANIENSP